MNYSKVHYFIFTVIPWGFVIMWAAGIRIHPEPMQKLLEKYTGPTKKEVVQQDVHYFKTELKNGTFAIGQLIGESPTSISLKLRGGVMNISKEDIVRTTVINPNEIKSGPYAKRFHKEKPDSIVSIRFQDSVFPFILKTIDKGLRKLKAWAEWKSE